jgi:hypothetical protein
MGNGEGGLEMTMNTSRIVETIELSKKYIQKRKLRANFIKIEITNSQGEKGVL